MKLQRPIDAARYIPRLWWMMLAGVATSFTTERPASQAIDGFLFWLGALFIWALLRLIVRRGPHASVRARRAGYVVTALGMAAAATQLNAREWLAALPVLLLAIQAGAFIAAEKHLQVWLIMVAGFGLLLYAALLTHSPLYLLCAAAFTLLALSILALDHREDRERAAVFATTAPARPGGTLLFVGATLLLTIPAYLFVPKPGGNWFVDEVQATPAADYPAAPLEQPAPAPPPMPFVELVAPPPSTAPLIEPPPRIAQPESGDYGEEFSITEVERRTVLANDIALYARSSHPVNLRGKLYDRFAGNRWSRTLALPQRVELTDGNSIRFPVRSGATRVEQSINIARELAPTLLHAPGVQSVRFPANALLGYEDGVLVALEPLRAGTPYSIESRLTLREGRYVLREAPGDLAPYLQADGASLRLRQLAQSLTTNVPGTWAKALALEQHLRTQYAYSYETIARQNYTPLDWFLFEGRRGHCEFFASALAMMLRSVGIASRVATGFSLHDANPITGFHEVRRLDGHAWVEAYLEGEGWILLEPTPFYPLPRPGVERQIAEAMDGYLERLASTRELLAPGALSTQLTVFTRDTWRGIRSGLQALKNAVRTLGWGLPLLLTAVVGGLLAVYLLVVAAVDWFDNLQIHRSLEELPAHDERTALLLVAAALLRVTTPRRFARRQDWTLREYASRLSEGTGLGHPGLAIPEEFIEAFDAARYGSVDRGMREPMAQVIALVGECIRHNRWPRLRAAVARLRRKWPNRVPWRFTTVST